MPTMIPGGGVSRNEAVLLSFGLYWADLRTRITIEWLIPAYRPLSGQMWDASSLCGMSRLHPPEGAVGKTRLAPDGQWIAPPLVQIPI